MTVDEVGEFLRMSKDEVHELMKTGQVDVGGTSEKPLILRRSVLTYDELRNNLG
jgi:hypothetical protein